jgi:hypothetical protein
VAPAAKPADPADPAAPPRPALAAARTIDEPRDATRGGVNGPALPGQRGRERPLSINEPRDATRPLLINEPRTLTRSRIGLGLVAGAVIASGLAGSFGYLASHDFDRAREAGCSADGRCPFGPAADLAQQSNHRARIAQVSAVGAVALAATGVTLWWVGRGKTHRTVTDVALRVGSSTSGLSTALSGRF